MHLNATEKDINEIRQKHVKKEKKIKLILFHLHPLQGDRKHTT